MRPGGGRRHIPSPWLTVWTSPRETARNLAWGDAATFVIVVAGLSGVLDVLQSMALKASLDAHWGAMAPSLALLLGPLLGFGYFLVAGASVSQASRWLGGQGDVGDTRSAMATATFPQLIALPLWLPVLWYYGLAVLFEKGHGSARISLPLAVFAALQALLMLWSAILKVVTLADVQGFSPLRALSSWLLAWLGVLVLTIGLIAAAMVLWP